MIVDNPPIIAVFDYSLLPLQDLEKKLVMIHENAGDLIPRVIALRDLKDVRQSFLTER